jgi:hypothetical protein
MEDADTLEKCIHTVVGWYARRAPWLDREELVQEAWVAALEAGDVPLPYAARVVSRRLSRFCWSLLSPVSDQRAGKHLSQLRRADADDPTVLALSSGVDPEFELLVAEGAALIEQFREALRVRLIQLHGGEVTSGVQAALRVLLDGDSSADAARCAGATINDTYNATNRMKAKAVKDSIVDLLLRNLEHRRIVCEHAHD